MSIILFFVVIYFKKENTFLRRQIVDINYGEYNFSDNKDLISMDKVYELLENSYWANNQIYKCPKKFIFACIFDIL